jgi:hypothetical protein
MIHPDNDDSVGIGTERNRNWIVQKLSSGYTFKAIYKIEDGKWSCGGSVKLNQNGSLSWTDDLPLILTKRKTFVSYYHKANQSYKDKFINLTSDLIINKSVTDGDISSEVSDEYIKQLIQKGYLSDTTVLIVLLGQKTKCRKHVDWEISGALNLKVGDNYAGLLGLKLPTHPDYGTGNYTYSEQPPRLTDNLKSGYAIIRDYTTDRRKIQNYIQLAFKNRNDKSDKRINSRKQLDKDLCG